jgi:hypothetical protein
MNNADFNIYRIDDIFIKIGYGCLILFILIGGTIVFKMAKSEALINPDSMYVGAIMFGVPALIFLAAGYSVRRREKTAVSVWRTLEMSPEVPARDLMAGTGFNRSCIEKALLTINRQGRGLYVWDRDSDTIVDVRLRQGMIMVENCDRCGARIGKKFPVSLDRAPQCPYCGNPLNMDRWNELKRNFIDDMKSRDMLTDRQAAAGQPAGRQAAFSKPLFVILLLLFWPAALIYALVNYRRT